MLKTMRHLLIVSSLVLLPASGAAQQGRAPIVVVDGIVIGNDSTATQVINRLAPADIVSIDVIKGAVATELYGTRASGGVIIIRTKASTDTAPVTEEQRLRTELLKQMRSNEQPSALTLRPQPLIILDGVVIGRGQAANLEVLHDRIERIEVVKGAAAVALYGPAAADGVILIVTK